MNSYMYQAPLQHMNVAMRGSMKEEEEKEQKRLSATAPSTVAAPVAAPVRLGQQTSPWGTQDTCMGLKILCGALGLVIVVLVVVLVIKMVAKPKGVSASASSPSSDSQLPMSLQGGFHFGDESLMSTSM